jgi:hypothetical protein
MKATRCSVEDCDRGAPIVHGMCTLHCRRMKVYGSTEMPPVLSTAERLTAGLERKPNGCLEWTRSTNHKGYGQIHIDGRNLATHRLAWELANGPIPPGMKVLHHCDNPPCCDAAKCLFLGTPADNTADMLSKGRHRGRLVTQCPDGHDYTEANTYVTAQGHRKCRACHNARTLAHYYKRRREGFAR